jgi:hypothetical protein
MSGRKLQWTTDEIRILLSIQSKDPNASTSDITASFNKQILARTRTKEAVKSQLKRQEKIKSKLQKGTGASSSGTQIGEPAHHAPHGQSPSPFSKAGKFKVLHRQLLGLLITLVAASTQDSSIILQDMTSYTNGSHSGVGT